MARPRRGHGSDDNWIDARASRIASSKTTNLGPRALAAEAVLGRAPLVWGAGHALFCCAPWSGFEERLWFGALFLR